MKITYQGKKLLKSNPTPSFEIGIFYKQGIGKNWFVNIGAGWGLEPFNYKYHFKAWMTNPAITSDEHDMNEYDAYNNHYVFPLTIQKLFPKSKNTSYSVEGGIKLYSIYNYPWDITGNVSIYIDEFTPDVSMFDFHIENLYQKYFLSYIAKVGLLRSTKRLNTLGINFLANYCPKNVGKGYYYFSNFDFVSKGDLALNLNYIGFEFAYGFALDKPKRDKSEKKIFKSYFNDVEIPPTKE